MAKHTSKAMDSSRNRTVGAKHTGKAAAPQRTRNGPGPRATHTGAARGNEYPGQGSKGGGTSRAAREFGVGITKAAYEKRSTRRTPNSR